MQGLNIFRSSVYSILRGRKQDIATRSRVRIIVQTVRGNKAPVWSAWFIGKSTIFVAQCSWRDTQTKLSYNAQRSIHFSAHPLFDSAKRLFKIDAQKEYSIGLNSHTCLCNGKSTSLVRAFSLCKYYNDTFLKYFIAKLKI